MWHRGTILWYSRSGLQQGVHLQWLVAAALLLSESAKLSSSASLQSAAVQTTTTEDMSSPILHRPPYNNDTYALPDHPVLPVVEHVLPRPPMLGPSPLPVPLQCTCRSSSQSTVLCPAATALSVMCTSGAAVFSIRRATLVC